MMEEKTSPAFMKDQILALSRQAGRISATIRTTSVEIPRNIIDELSHLEGQLYKISHQAAAFEEEHSNMVALTSISQMINSSLEVDEVLRIAMDTVVQMINAE
ncbi:MAG: hypothetical protein ISR59_08975, partial [Anaerolineales bacterium]|nr:hypothetical protein [Anaerolineales bacterium]